MEIWELDFASRPLVNEEGKRVWELLIWGPNLRYLARCAQKEATRAFVIEHLELAIAQNGASPDSIKLMRPTGFGEQACIQMGLPCQVSARSYGLRQWVRERETTVYPQEPGYQTPKVLDVATNEIVAKLAPDTLLGERWALVSLPASDLSAVEPPAFGEFFLPPLPPTTTVPGLVLFSKRALPLAAWMQGVSPAAVWYLAGEADEKIGIGLEVGAGDRWWLVRFATKELQRQQEGRNFEAQKKVSKGYHFLAIQSETEEEPVGFWMLWD